MSNFATGQCAYFDADSIEMPLRLRTAEAGDRMRPQGAASQKALVSLLAERGVPRQHRAKTLVVEAAGKIIWAVDLAIDADSLPTAQTHRMLKLTLRPRQIASN
jgi:tRNA(Ile)-lysidine synthetase-like protein